MSSKEIKEIKAEIRVVKQPTDKATEKIYRIRQYLLTTWYRDLSLEEIEGRRIAERILCRLQQSLWV